MYTKFARWFVLVFVGLLIFVVSTSAQTYPYTYTNMVAWSPNTSNQLVAVGGTVFQSATQGYLILNIYDTSGNLQTNLTNHLNGYSDFYGFLEWNPSGDCLGIALIQQLMIWNKNSATITTIPNITASSIRWSPDGEFLGITTDDGYLMIWEITPSGYSLIESKYLQTANFVWLTNNQIATTGALGTRLWNVTTSGIAGNIQTNRIDDQFQNFISASIAWRIRNNQPELIVSGVTINNQNQQTPIIYLYNVQTGILSNLPFAYPPIGFQVSPDKSRIVILGGDGFIYVHAVDSGQQLSVHSADTPGAAYQVAWSPDSTKLAFGSLGTYIDVVTPPQPAVMQTTATETPTSELIAPEVPPGAVLLTLTAPGCQGPCWLGIEPQRTSESELIQIFDANGVDYEKYPLVYADDGFAYEFPTPIGQFTLLTPNSWGAVEVIDGVVMNVSIPLSAPVSAILGDYGTPDYIIKQAGSTLDLLYRDEGLVFSVGSNLERVGSLRIENSSYVDSLYANVPDLQPCQTPTNLCNLSLTGLKLGVNAIILYNKTNSSDIAVLNHLDVFPLNSLPTQNISIRADTSPQTIGSVVFEVNEFTFIDNTPPYIVENFAFLTGAYRVAATPYSGANGTGIPGKINDLVFEVVAQTPTTSVTSLSLINADTDTSIQTLTSGNTLNLGSLPTRNLNIRADASGSPAKVIFMLIGKIYREDVTAPFTLAEDSIHFEAGSYTLTATPYDANNIAGTPLSVMFEVVDDE